MSSFLDRLRDASAALLHDIKGPSPAIILTTPEQENFGRAFGVDTARLINRPIRVDARGEFEMEVVTRDNFYESRLVLESGHLLKKMECIFNPTFAYTGRNTEALAFDKITALRVTDTDGNLEYFAVTEIPSTIMEDRARRLWQIKSHESTRPIPKSAPTQASVAKP